MTSIVDLLDVVRAHLVGFDVAAPCSVTVSSGGPLVSVQLSDTAVEPPALVQRLLTWIDTLTDPAAHLWRIPDRDAVHLWVTGRLPDTTPVRVFTELPYTPTGLGGGLEPDQRAPVPLAALRHLADLATPEVTIR